LHLSFPTEFKSLDPALGFDTYTIPLTKLMFRGLIDYDDGTGLVTDMAKDWNVSPDARIYSFHLLPGQRFSNGREVEGADFICAIERVVKPETGSPGQTYFLDIKGAQEFSEAKAPHISGLSAPDKYTLVIELKAPRFAFRYVLTTAFACAVPRDIAAKYGKDFESHLIGAGAYQVAEWRRGIHWRFERNPYYTGKLGFVDTIDVMIGGDEALHTMMLRRGEIDQVPESSPAQSIQFKRDPRFRSWLQPVDTANTDYFFMNTEVKPFDDPRVRRALCYAINRERQLKLAGGFGTVADGVVPPALPWTNATMPHYEYSPEKARALLREAGYPNGFQTQLWYMGDQPVYSRLAQGVQQDLQQVGVRAEMWPVNAAAFQKKVETRHQAPCGVWGWFLDYPDASDFLDVLLNGERITDTDCNNAAFYSNPEVNRRLDAAIESPDNNKRTRLFREAENIVLEDAPWVPLINEQVPVLYHPRVHAKPHPVWMWRYERMWLDN
jgi:ABC-type transport system substrate-binding protein